MFNTKRKEKKKKAIHNFKLFNATTIESNNKRLDQTFTIMKIKKKINQKKNKKERNIKTQNTEHKILFFPTFARCFLFSVTKHGIEFRKSKSKKKKSEESGARTQTQKQQELFRERKGGERESHRRVGGLDSGFGGDDGVGGGENRLGGGAVVVVAACHAGIRMRERDHFPVTGDREWTAAERFLGSKKQSWIWKTEN